MAGAAAEVVDCIRVLEKSGSNLVAEALGGREFIEMEHYPPDDVRDPKSGSQFYFHAHPQTRGQWNDYGHFHLFLGAASIPSVLKPVVPDQCKTSEGGDAALCHLIAISMTRQGRPVRLFTTNRWVTGGLYYEADELITVIDRFELDHAHPSSPLNRWMIAMLGLYRNEIGDLLLARDCAVTEWQSAHPATGVFEDRALEITSALDIDLDNRLEEIRRALRID
ncbi:MAG: hypothetical protein ISS15_06840 [Alphaproteobacteria bacterium]|nr:hypothetical protein [Alphaproteobacteria bacterium]MBL7097354.1 hypothetical protein [Alphaproteobacteria bacterium]